jgi:hypothetical protein
MMSSVRALLVFTSVLTLITYVQTASIIMEFGFEPTPFHTVVRSVAKFASLDFLHFTALECQYALTAAGRIAYESCILLALLFPLVLVRLLCCLPQIHWPKAAVWSSKWLITLTIIVYQVSTAQ